jgi:hypothetical protein
MCTMAVRLIKKLQSPVCVHLIASCQNHRGTSQYQHCVHSASINAIQQQNNFTQKSWPRSTIRIKAEKLSTKVSETLISGIIQLTELQYQQ